MASYVTIYDSRRFVRSDSTDTTTVLPVVAGGTGTTTATGTAGSVVLSISPALTGTPTAPTAAAATNTTQVATTAFVQAALVAPGVVITVKDANFTVTDDGDTSKKLQFQLSGFSTATTRTVTWPDANITVARIDAGQTFAGTHLFSSMVGVGSAAAPTAAAFCDVAENAAAVRRMRLSNTNAAGSTELIIQSGDATTSARSSIVRFFTSETSSQDWRVGMNGTTSFVIRDQTGTTDRVSVDQTTGAVTLANALIQPYATGTFTIPTGKYMDMSDQLTLTSTQVGTVSGTGTLRIN